MDLHFRAPPPAESARRPWSALHETGVALSADEPSCWLVGGAHEAAHVLRGGAFGSSILGDGGVPIRCPESGACIRPQDTLLASDGAHHGRRKAVLVEALQDAMSLEEFERRARFGMQQLRPLGACDFLADFAFPASNAATHAVLGLPHAELPAFSEEIDVLMASLARPLVDRARFEALMERMIERVQRGLHVPAEEGRPGALAFLGDAWRRARITRLEALSLAASIIQGMSRTAAILAACALRRGIEQTAAGENTVRGNEVPRSSSCQWVADTLRRSPPVHSLLRVAGDDAQVGGYSVPPGMPVAVCLRALGSDPEGKLWAFGAGPHACPAGRLGQAMAERLVAAALDALEGIEIDPRDAECHDELHPVFSGPAHLRLRWRVP